VGWARGSCGEEVRQRAGARQDTSGAGCVAFGAALKPRFGPPPPLFLHDMLFTFATLGVWLIGAGLFSVILSDHRRRCRTCLRRLIMPIASGSWGHMVIFGRPRTELICPFGHGTLSIEELQITGRQMPDWQPHDDNIWKELESYYQARR